LGGIKCSKRNKSREHLGFRELLGKNGEVGFEDTSNSWYDFGSGNGI
jgi:hypothetical protein